MTHDRPEQALILSYSCFLYFFSQAFDIAFSPDGRWVASGSDDETVRVWDASSELLLGVLTGHDGPVTSVRWSEDDQLLSWLEPAVAFAGGLPPK